MLTKMDQVALGLYCEAFARWKNANDRVVKHGAIVKSPNNYPIQSPFLAIALRRIGSALRFRLVLRDRTSARVSLHEFECRGFLFCKLTSESGEISPKDRQVSVKFERVAAMRQPQSGSPTG